MAEKGERLVTMVAEETKRPVITPEQVEQFLQEERARREREVKAHLEAITRLGYELVADIKVVDGRLVGEVLAVPKGGR